MKICNRTKKEIMLKGTSKNGEVINTGKSILKKGEFADCSVFDLVEIFEKDNEEVKKHIISGLEELNTLKEYIKGDSLKQIQHEFFEIAEHLGLDVNKKKVFGDNEYAEHLDKTKYKDEPKKYLSTNLSERGEEYKDEPKKYLSTNLSERGEEYKDEPQIDRGCFNKERIENLKEKWREYNQGWDEKKESIPVELYHIIEEIIERLFVLRLKDKGSL